MRIRGLGESIVDLWIESTWKHICLEKSATRFFLIFLKYWKVTPYLLLTLIHSFICLYLSLRDYILSEFDKNNALNDMLRTMCYVIYLKHRAIWLLANEMLYDQSEMSCHAICCYWYDIQLFIDVLYNHLKKTCYMTYWW